MAGARLSPSTTSASWSSWLAGRPGWWVVLFFIPLANTAVAILVALDVARAFGKSKEFGVIGLYMFAFVGYLMTGFGSAKYLGQPQR